ERLAPGDGIAYAHLFEEFGAHADRIFALLSTDLASPAANELLGNLMLAPAGGFPPVAAGLLRPARHPLEGRLPGPGLAPPVPPWPVRLGRGPDEANSGFWVALTLAALQQGGYPTPVGGSEMLARTLARLIEDHGGQIRAESPVTEILVEQGAAVGVRTAAGGTVRASRAVVASTGPDQLYLKLLANTDVVPAVVRQQASQFRYGRGAFQIHLALSEPPRFADERLNRTGQTNLTTGLDGVS